MLNYVTVDIESANEWHTSICAIAIVCYENGLETESYSTYVYQPENHFSDFCTGIHGITYKDVEDAPHFDEITDKISALFSDKIVFAHNAAYDIPHILTEYARSESLYPTFNYACSLNIARRAIKGMPNYRLDTLCENFSIDLDHHNALSDARACGELVIQISKALSVESIDEIFTTIKYHKGSISPDTYEKAHSIRIRSASVQYKKIAESMEINKDADPHNYFYEKIILFTGALNITRKEAMQLVADRGGVPTAGMKKSVNILVVGRDDYGNFKEGGKSSKMIKAEKYISQGADMEIISEEDFFEHL